MHQILVVEDDQSTREQISSLIRTLPDTDVHVAADRSSAEVAISRCTYDLAIIDIDLGAEPGALSGKYSGLALIPLLGRTGTITIVVSGVTEENLPDVTLALSAFDFLTKPYRNAQLIVKVKHALALREAGGAKELKIEDGAYVDPNIQDDPNHTPGLLWKGRPIRLTITEYRLVFKLLRAGGSPVDREVLADEMDSATSSGALATHVSSIRKKFKDKDSSFNSIKTIPALGYAWKT